MQPNVVVPVDPFQGGELDFSEGTPRAFAVDLLGLVETDRGFGQRVVVPVADRSDRRVDAGVDEAAGEREAGVLARLNESSQQRVGEMTVGIAPATGTWVTRLSSRRSARRAGLSGDSRVHAGRLPNRKAT
jgi:hypothetical protein